MCPPATRGVTVTSASRSERGDLRPGGAWLRLRAARRPHWCPANFRAVVIQAVTHGGVPKSVSAGAAGGAARGHQSLVDQVIHAAENAFASGLHVALLTAAAMLLAAAAVTLAPESGPVLMHPHRRGRAHAS